MDEHLPFTVYTDHKPLIRALLAKPERYSPRQTRHLDIISQCTMAYSIHGLGIHRNCSENKRPIDANNAHYNTLFHHGFMNGILNFKMEFTIRAVAGLLCSWCLQWFC